jgi:glycosyltransferase involved in cell wall biosynthesis
VIGFLSNISFAKGIDRYLDLLADLRARGSNVTGLVAGPFDDEKVRDYVERRIKEIGRITYLGPVYGDRKESFFASIDLLVFPTRLHEAQPLVIFEAQAAGVPVAAPDCGCIAQMGGADSELLLDFGAANLAALTGLILAWEAQPQSYLDARQRLRRRFVKLLDGRAADTARFNQLVSAYR